MLEVLAAKKDSGVDAALIVSIASATASAAAFCLASLVAFQNRPSITVYSTTAKQLRGDEVVTLSRTIFVANTGKQPVALTDVGYRHVKGWNGWWARKRHRDSHGQLHPVRMKFIHDPEMLQVGEMKRYEVDPMPPDAFYTPGVSVYAFAADARGRVTYASEGKRVPSG